MWLLALPFLAAAQQGAVEGQAFNKLTKAPVPDVHVLIAVRGEPGNYREAVTGIDGKYRVDDLPPGEYTPNLKAPAGMFGPPIMELAFKRIQISDGVVRFDIPITPASLIRGRVFDPDRGPVARARLIALPVAGVSGGMATTDGEGRFSMPLAPGKYRLRVQPADGGWAPTYYPNATEPSAAEILVIGEAAGLDGIDIRLRPASANRLSGIVRDDQGKPAPGVELSIHETEAFLSNATKVVSDAKGAFAFTAVPPGQWQISATAGRDSVRWMGRATVTMPDRDLDNAVVRIDPPFPYKARLEGAPSGRPMPLSVEMSLTTGIGASLAAREREGMVTFDRLYPGNYRIGVFGSMPGRYLKAILLGDADITGRPIDLSSSSPRLRLVYAPNDGHISGEVENGAGAKVVLMWADRDNYIPGADSMTITCNDTGHFATPDLRPGSWYAVAFPPSMRGLPADALRNRLFDRGLWREAASVRIAEGETADVKLKITPWID